MSVNNKAENYLNYITGSGGGWTSNTNQAIAANLDYIIESGSGDVYFNEMNTACGVYGSYNEQTASFNLIADYVNEKGCSTVYIYGQNDEAKENPSAFQQPLISSSFARHGISVNYEYNGNTSHTYFSQRGQNQFTGSFHLWMQTPWFSDDTLLNIVSGSFDKNSFRTILGSSPESSCVPPLFNTGSFTTSNPHHPDFVVKNPNADGTLQARSGIDFYRYIDSNPTYQDAVDSGSLLIEKYIIPSGSEKSNEGYNPITKNCYWMTPDKQILHHHHNIPLDETFKWVLPSGADKYQIRNQVAYTTPSGSEVAMYDGSTKQIQDVQVGDIVKSYLPVGMPDEIFADDWTNYSTDDLTGSTPSGSVVIRSMNHSFYGYSLINGSLKFPVSMQAQARTQILFVKQDDTWSWKSPRDLSVGNHFLDTSGNEVEITSISQVSQSMDFYSLDVEDIDTYFSSNILVHNIPTKICFTYDTMVTLADGTYKEICKVRPNDMIKTYDEETGKLQNSKVLETVKVLHDNIVTYKFDNNTKIKGTDNHPFYVVGEGYKAPLEIGDVVLNDELNKLKLVRIEVDNVEEITYNINRTDNGKNYFANKVLVSDESDM
jgi:hypothetical protein